MSENVLSPIKADIERDIYDRLEHLRSLLNLQKQAFAAVLGCSPSFYSELKNGSTHLNAVMLYNLHLYESKINVNWIVTGECLPFREPSEFGGDIGAIFAKLKKLDPAPDSL